MIRRACLMTLFLFVMVGCSPQQSAPESTISTRTLPPTWTPEPSPEPLETNTLPPPSQTLTPSPQIELTLADHREGATNATQAALTSLPPGAGGKIAYGYSDVSSIFQIFTMNPDGTDQTLFVPNEFGDVGFPLWSPDGSHLAFTCNNQICVIRQDGSESRQLTELESGPSGFAGFVFGVSWLPDSQTIAFSYAGLEEPSGIYTIDIAGGPSTLMFPDTFAAAWSPDGSQIAHIEAGEAGRGELYMRSSQGSASEKIVDLAVSTVAWSPDGEFLVLAVNEPNSGFEQEIYTVRPDGSDVRKLTDNDWEDGFPSWSPDGSKIVFTSSQFGHNDIFIMDVDGSNLQRITNSPNSEITPSWQP